VIKEAVYNTFRGGDSNSKCDDCEKPATREYAAASDTKRRYFTCDDHRLNYTMGD
jgi:hypothetical protein